MSVVILFVESQNSSSERRFKKSLTVAELQSRLEPIVGISTHQQLLSIYQNDTLVSHITTEDPTRQLGYYPVTDYMALRVTSTVPHSADTFEDPNVEKYVMDDDQYDRRADSVRAFKRRHQMGRFSDGQSSMSIEEPMPEHVKVGERCEVSGSEELKRRGVVRYVGQPEFSLGYWVGVEYDEPMGKNDGSVDGVRYFSCQMNHGSFVRPEKVTVGDYPPEDLFDSDLEEM